MVRETKRRRDRRYLCDSNAPYNSKHIDGSVELMGCDIGLFFGVWGNNLYRSMWIPSWNIPFC